MHYSLLSQSFIYACFFTAVFSFVFGIFIYYKNRKSYSFFWLLTCLSVSLWSFSFGVQLISDSYKNAFFWNRLLNIGAILIPIFYFTFVVLLLDKLKIYRKYLYVSYLITLFLICLASFTHLLVKDVPPKFDFKYWLEPGVFYYSYFLYFILYFLASFYILWGNYKVISSPIRKNQIKYLLIGSVLGFCGGVTSFFPQLFNIYPFGNYFVSVYIFLIAYAISRYNLMDIKLVIRKSLVVSFTFITQFIFLLFFYLIIKHYLPGQIWPILMIIVLISVFYPPIKNFYYRLSNKYLFSSLYDSRVFINELEGIINNCNPNSDIFDLIFKKFKDTFHIKGMIITSFDEKMKLSVYEYIGSNWDKEKIDLLLNKVNAKKIFNDSQKLIIAEEFIIKHYIDTDTEYEVDFLLSSNVSIIVPLVTGNNVIGYFMLPGKESGDVYNNDDFSVLKRISNHLAFVLDNLITFDKQSKEIELLKRELEGN